MIPIMIRPGFCLNSELILDIVMLVDDSAVSLISMANGETHQCMLDLDDLLSLIKKAREEYCNHG